MGIKSYTEIEGYGPQFSLCPTSVPQPPRPLCPSGTIDKCAGKLRVVSMLIQRICAWRDALYDE